ncbi:MAG TPA: LysR family transcriptional regulator [Planctomycetota bacterium]|nr:LysR family transcriptional regulator [Planctomycetota bacterium]
MIGLDELRSFSVFADCLNFTRAAEELHISQPALHVKIRKLAENLRVPLYRRQGRRLELTEQGKRVAAFGRDMQDRSLSFVQELTAGTVDAPVILAAGEGAYLYLLGPALKQFAKRDSAPLRLLTLDADGAIDAVRAGKAHLGVASLETVPDGLEAQVLARVEQVLVLPDRHPLAAREELKLSDLKDQPLIVPPPGRPHRILLARALQSANVPWKVAVEAGGWELMIEFVRMGMGLAVVNGFCAFPRGVVARPLRGLPAVQYHVFHLRGMARQGAPSRLRQALLERR